MSKDDRSKAIDKLEKIQESIRTLEKLRDNLTRAHYEMASKQIIGEVEGLVAITMNGRREILKVEITDEAFSKSKKELEQLIQRACNNAKKIVEQTWMFEAAFSDKLNS